MFDLERKPPPLFNLAEANAHRGCPLSCAKRKTSAPAFGCCFVPSPLENQLLLRLERNLSEVVSRETGASFHFRGAEHEQKHSCQSCDPHSLHFCRFGRATDPPWPRAAPPRTRPRGAPEPKRKRLCRSGWISGRLVGRCE